MFGVFCILLQRPGVILARDPPVSSVRGVIIKRFVRAVFVLLYIWVCNGMAIAALRQKLKLLQLLRP